ncbi:Ig-like domain-containing protein (plasmid) [Bacillus sp. F19]|nr:Ig-like domain-containing protein [Bacillus sp. F19]
MPEVKVSTVIGKTPILPSMLEVKLSDNTKTFVSVTWGSISYKG